MGQKERDRPHLRRSTRLGVRYLPRWRSNHGTRCTVWPASVGLPSPMTTTVNRLSAPSEGQFRYRLRYCCWAGSFILFRPQHRLAARHVEISIPVWFTNTKALSSLRLGIPIP